ncbi:hypothetical protein ACTHUR_16930, partial [Neisseria sp. P0021.S007]|uniref:hypothetical protein n=1 Tax=Neisseria sp. P0021.S007 TaxID=3436822 RepID=UPI003F7D755D
TYFPKLENNYYFYLYCQEQCRIRNVGKYTTHLTIKTIPTIFLPQTATKRAIRQSETPPDFPYKWKKCYDFAIFPLSDDPMRMM